MIGGTGRVPPPLPPKGNQHEATPAGGGGPTPPPKPKKPEKRKAPPKPKPPKDETNGAAHNGTMNGTQMTGTPMTPTPAVPQMPQRELTPEEKEQAKKEKKKRMREKVAKEIASTELSYVESLETLNKLYIIPLMSASTGSSPILSKEVIDQIFSNIQLISGLNRKFLTDLVDRIDGWHDGSCIGKVFIDFAHFFKMYTSYVNNHDTAVETFKAQFQSNSKFEQFCEEKEALPESQTQRLHSFLIMPIQRVPRYKLLLEELLKNTAEDHPDHKELVEALQLVKDVATQINEAVKSQENRAIIIRIQEQFQGDVTFVEPSRVFLRKGPLTKKCRSSDKRYHFFLFSDLLVYAAKNAFKYKLHRSLPINGAFIVQDLPDDDRTKNKFQIVSKNKSFVVYCDDKATKDSWLSDLYQCISLQKNTNLKADPAEVAGVLAPVWQPDGSSKSCSICSAKFSIFHRRHHCRRCGNLVCGDCSKTRAILKANDAKRIQRVCDRCILELKKKSSPSPTQESDAATMYDSGTLNGDGDYDEQSSSEEESEEEGKDSREIIRYCKALYEYIADDERELTMKPGDIIAILHEDDSGWWTGELNEQQGIFPSTYVDQNYEMPGMNEDDEIFRVVNPFSASDSDEDEPAEEPEDDGDDGKHIVVATMDYTPGADGELGFEKDDEILVQNKDPSGWWCGKRVTTGEVGWFSPEFVQDINTEPVLKTPDPIPPRRSVTQPASADAPAGEFKPCTTCHCKAFAPNPFRPKSCRDCWHNISFHS